MVNTDINEVFYMISRTHRGLAVQAKSLDQLSTDVRFVFLHAVTSYGFLVGWNETLTEAEWRGRIQRTYQESPRIQQVLEAIEVAMGTPALAQEPSESCVFPMFR